MSFNPSDPLAGFVKFRMYEDSFADKILNLRKIKSNADLFHEHLSDANFLEVMSAAFDDFFSVEAVAHQGDETRGGTLEIKGRLREGYVEKLKRHLDAEELRLQNDLMLHLLQQQQAEIEALKATIQNDSHL